MNLIMLRVHSRGVDTKVVKYSLVDGIVKSSVFSRVCLSPYSIES